MFGTGCSQENIENPNDYKVSIFPSNYFFQSMNRYDELRNMENVCLGSIWWDLLILDFDDKTPFLYPESYYSDKI